MKGGESLEKQIAALPDLDRAALVEIYQRLYAKPAPLRMPREQLELAVAIRLHKQLNANLRAKMMQALLASEAIASILSTNSRHTELVREWRGRLYRVVILDAAVMYQNQKYRSLSAVAQAITGQKISGAKFFRVPVEKHGQSRSGR